MDACEASPYLDGSLLWVWDAAVPVSQAGEPVEGVLEALQQRTCCG